MSTLKVGWGTKIAVLYGGFVILIVTLVAGSMRQSFDLVSSDYYAQELKYQEVLDAGKNSSALSAPLQLNIAKDEVSIKFPAEFQGKDVNGSIHFYSPVNEAWDKTISFNASNNTASVNKRVLKATSYTAKINWTCGGKSYYQETKINLSNHE